MTLKLFRHHHHHHHHTLSNHSANVSETHTHRHTEMASTNGNNYKEKGTRVELINERLKTLSLHCGKTQNVVTISQIIINYPFRW